MPHVFWMAVGVVLLLARPVTDQETTIAASEAEAFMGSWVISMTVPKNAQETVRVWTSDGKVAASVQAQQFPPLRVADIAKIGKYLILGVQRFENGKPIQAIVILWREGETMNMIQELEGSTVTKRGTGRQQ